MEFIKKYPGFTKFDHPLTFPGIKKGHTKNFGPNNIYID